jgi:hypothetical protein
MSYKYQLGDFRASGSIEALDGQMSASLGFSGSNITTHSGNVNYLVVDDRLSLGGPGSQFFAYNEDTAKVKFANWYTTGSNQYGMGMLWYETWFAAIDTDGDANDVNRRIGFYLEEPNAGATDTVGGTGTHPTNARMYVDVSGAYMSGAVEITNGLRVTGAVKSTMFGAENEIVLVSADNALTSSDALSIDASGNVGIGTSSPEVRLHIDGNGPQTAQIRLEQHNDTADAPDIRIRRSRGTHDSPSTLNANDYMFRLNVDVYDGSDYTNTGQLRWDNDGTTDNNGTNNVFGLQTRVAGNTADRLTIDSSGNATFSGEVTGSNLSLTNASGIAGVGLTNNSGKLDVKSAVQTLNSGTISVANGTIVFADASGGNISLTLPPASDLQGVVLKIKQTGGSNTVAISASAGTIDGDSDLLLESEYAAVSIVASGSNYYIV